MPVRALRVDVLSGPDKGASKVASSESVTIGTADGNDLVLADPTVSRYHLELGHRGGAVDVLDCGSTNGTFAGNVRVHRATVPAGTVLRLGKTELRVADGERMSLALHERDVLAGLHGRAPVMRRLMVRLERAAQTDIAVLLCGESGTGKELIARGLHSLGPRASGPFVTVDCGSLSPTLVASELFGHERGAFTGADRQRIGAFEQANGGTLFLDEIGELPGALQTTLLGVLERRKLRRLGGRQDVTVDVRIVSATNRDLRAEVNSGAFRLDLYYRVAVVMLQVPPLRDRLDDIPLLVEHFLRELGHTGPIEQTISPAVMVSLERHHWPGNVRELRNLIEVTVAMGETPSLDDAVRPAGGGGGDLIDGLLAASYKEARSTLLAEFERRYLTNLLERAEGNVSRAAREARMDRSHLIDLLRRHDLR